MQPDRVDLGASGSDTSRRVQADLLTTPWVSSWIGRSRPGDRFDSDASRRAGAWATWAVESLTEIANGDRRYPALRLDGRFYDPKGTGTDSGTRPHLEIPRRVVDAADDEFPDRLASAGNGLAFAWFRFDEVTAIRRALFNGPTGRVADAVDQITERRAALVDVVERLGRTAGPRWDVVERLLVDSSDGLSETVTGEFTTNEIVDIVPALAEFSPTVSYDSRLAERNGRWASRRLGVWQLRGTNESGEPFAFGIVTPRLTANSVFSDELFAPRRESAAALLVRALILNRLIVRHLGAGTSLQSDAQNTAPDPTGKAHLRAVVARVGAKVPEASTSSVAHFLQTHPDPDAAWRALNRWAGDTHLLTVSESSFRKAHTSALRAVRRAEDPTREDIDTVLPLAWVNGRVARVTFSQPTS